MKRESTKLALVPSAANSLHRVADLRGMRFERLRVLSLARVERAGAYWLCRCDCGGEVTLQACALRTGHSRSCGCLKHEVDVARRACVTHGKSKTAEYKTWSKMIGRCENPRDGGFSDYGGRGITVCRRWRSSFENFLADMGPRPAGLTIERVDNNKGYSPANCRWATRAEQRLNTRRTVRLTYRGETLPLKEWAKRVGISYAALYLRVHRRHWPVARALAGVR